MRGDEDEENDKEEDANETKPISELDKDLDPPGVDVWHWKDPVVQPRQGVMAGRDKDFTYLSAWTLASDSFAKLADDNVRSLTLTGDQHHAVGYDSTPYEPALRESWNDVYVYDTESGERNMVLERIENVSISPDGAFALYFPAQMTGGRIPSQRETHTNLTEDIDTQFNDFTAIYGREADRAFGSAQWSEGDETVLLYDQYDVYRVNANGQRRRETHLWSRRQSAIPSNPGWILKMKH